MESPKTQLVVLILVLVDLFVVLLEVIVSVNLVQFVDPDFGYRVETALVPLLPPAPPLRTRRLRGFVHWSGAADFWCKCCRQHIVSISILTLFEIELMLMMFVYRKEFFVGRGSFWLNMDLIVVVRPSQMMCHTSLDTPHLLSQWCPRTILSGSTWT